MAEQFIGVEATGVYVGKLVEDMIETVKREKKLYCNVYIPEFFAENSNYPLTYVPFWAMSLPLRKDDKVLVEFHQNNLMYPVLYKNPDEIDEQFFEQFDTNKSVDGGNIEGYEPTDTVGAERIGVDSYIIKTDDYTVIHQNNGFILIDKDDKVYTYGSEINIISSGKVNVDCDDDIQVFTNSNCKVVAKKDCEIETDGNTKITVKKDCEIKSTGNTKITADQDCEIKSTGNTKINATQNCEIQSTGNTKITATQNCEIQATAQCKITASAGFSVNNHLQVTP